MGKLYCVKATLTKIKLVGALLLLFLTIPVARAATSNVTLEHALPAVTMPHEAVFVESNIPNYKTLLNNLRPGAEVYVLDASKDGLDQMAKTLAGRSGIAAIHLITHGSEGTLELGALELGAKNLRSHAGDLATIGAALQPGGDILLYGCDVAKGTDGAAFVQSLARGAHAVVAASTDLTGAADQGGDWTLEYATGALHVPALHYSSYRYTLAQQSINLGGAVTSGSLASGTFTIGGVQFAITSTVPYTVSQSGSTLTISQNSLPTNTTNGNGTNFVLTITKPGGGSFKAYSMGITNNSTGGDPSFGPQMHTYWGTFSSSIITGANTIDYTNGTGTATSNTQLTVDDWVYNNTPEQTNITLTSLSVDLGTSAPTTTVASAALSADTGSSSSDWITKTAGQTISGTLSANLASGESVQVTYDGGTTWSNATSFTVGSSAWLTTTTLSGSNTFEARVTNASGSSAAYTHSYTLDTTAPTVTAANISISGGSGTGGAYKIGDTVTATWNDTAGGDANTDVASATADFSQFGGGSAVAMSNSAGTWTATYTITSGAIDGTNKNVSVTATDNAGNTATTADTTNATVDNIAPTVTDANISISGGSGTGGAYKIGDTVTATWNDTAAGDNNSDTIAGATVDFSQFGGGASVVMSNSAGLWTATYTIVSGTLNNATNRNVAVTVTDNAGNMTTTADTTNATVDTTSPSAPMTAIALTAASDTGSSNSDGITNDTSPTMRVSLSGTNAVAGDSVELLLGSVSLTHKTTAVLTNTDITNNYVDMTVTAGDLGADGSKTFTAQVTDTTGNTGPAGGSKSITLDTTAPTALASVSNLSSPSASSFTFTVNYADSGGIDATSIATGNVSVTGPGAIGMLTVTGASYNGATGVATYTVQAPHGGTWNTATDAGTYTIGINGNSVKDVAGNAVAANASAATFNVSFAPTSTVATAALSQDTGTSNTDFITNVASQTISGTLSANLASGESVQVSYDGGSTWSNATSYTVGSSSWSTTTTLSGSNTFEARVTNANGSSTAYTHVYTLDTTAAAPALALAADTGPSSTDKITSNGQVNVSGLESGASWQYSTDNGTTWTAGTGSSVTFSTNGTYTVIVKQTDVAGNTSPNSTAFTFTLVTTGPTISGISPNQGPTTGGLLVTITGSNFAAPATVTIGGVAATQVAVVSTTKITAVTPAHALGAVSVTVSTTGGSITGTNIFTYIVLPNPAKDPEVIGLINQQQETARQIWQAQIGNFQQHLESLHHVIGSNEAVAGGQHGATDAAASLDGGRVAAVRAGRPMRVAANDVGSAASSGWLANTLLSIMTSSSVTVDVARLMGNNMTTGSATLKNDGYELWGAGHVRIGTKKDQTGTSNIDYTTSGVSFGADHRINEHLILGLGIGYAYDHSEFGSAGTNSKTEGGSVTVYGSYQPVTAMYADFLLGYGSLSMDSSRYVTATGAIAQSNRSGGQLYGSLSAGYEYRHDTTLLSPYARYDFGQDRLDAATETGAGIYSLNYSSQKFNTQQLSLGLRAQASYLTGIGLITPRARVEYQHHINGNSQSTVAYADLVATRYSLTTPSASGNSMLLGVGCSLVLKNKMNVNLDYQWARSNNDEVSQTIFARLSKVF